MVIRVTRVIWVIMVIRVIRVIRVMSTRCHQSLSHSLLLLSSFTLTVENLLVKCALQCFAVQCTAMQESGVKVAVQSCAQLCRVEQSCKVAAFNRISLWAEEEGGRSCQLKAEYWQIADDWQDLDKVAKVRRKWIAPPFFIFTFWILSMIQP